MSDGMCWLGELDESWPFVRECVETILRNRGAVWFFGKQPPRWVHHVNTGRSWVSAKAEGFACYAPTVEDLFEQCGLRPASPLERLTQWWRNQ